MTTPRPGLAIDAIGSYLPPLRGNDWWPADTVARWRAASADAPPPELPDDARLVAALGAAARFRGDPFQGATVRPVMPDDMTTADMEVRAAEDALSRSAVARDDIAFVIQHSSGNAHVQPVNAFAVHARLGLRKECLTFGVDAENDSFQVQLALAESLLAVHGGHALLLQSSQRTRFVDWALPSSTSVGDGATAVIVSRSGAARVLGDAHLTNSELVLPYSVGAADDTPWWNGPVALRPASPDRLRRHFVAALARMLATLDLALARASVTSRELDVLAAHQHGGWAADAYGRAFPGIGHVPDTFARHASLGACNLPLALAQARADRGGPLGLTALVSGGIGNIDSATVIDWSRQ